MLTGKDFLFPKQAKIRETGPDPWRVILPARGIHLMFLAGILTLIWLYSLLHRKKHRAGYPPGTLTVVFFVMAAFIGYLVLFSWYRPNGKGERLMFSLYVPVVFSLIWAAVSIDNRFRKSEQKQTLSLIYGASHLFLTAMILWRIYELANHPVFFTK